MTVALQAIPQFFDNAGNPLSGGKIYSYEAGTLIPLSTYTDRAGTTPNANPVVLDAAGRADIWLTANVPYKLIVQDAGGTTMDSVDQFYAGADPSQLVAAGIVPATGGTYTGPVSFAGGVSFDGTDAQDVATLDSLGISSVQNANLWVNSDFAMNRKNAASAADGTLGFDKIVALCSTGSVGISQLAQPLDGVPYALRTTQPDAVAKYVGLAQVVPSRNVLAYRGKSIALAAKVRCSVNTTIRCALVAWTGAVDAAPNDVVNNWASTTYTAGNFFIANTVTIAVSATAATAGQWVESVVSSSSAGGTLVPSNMQNLYMVVWTDAQIAQNATLDASVIRCGQGVNAPLWTPPDSQVEALRITGPDAVLLASTGYQKFPSGLIMQWGQVSGNTDALGAITGAFAIPFPNTVYSATLTNGSTASYAHPLVNTLGLSGVYGKFINGTVPLGAGVPVQLNWLAFGS